MSSCYNARYAMESKCHSGFKCVYDTVKERNWDINILKHPIKFIVEKVRASVCF